MTSHPTAGRRCDGLPDHLPGHARLLLRALARELVVAIERDVTSYGFEPRHDALAAHRRWHQRTREPVAELADSSFGPIAALMCGDDVTLAIVNQARVLDVISLPGRFIALAAAGTIAVLVLRQQARGHAVAYAVDLGARSVTAERPLASDDIAIAADPTSGRFALTDRTNRRVMLVDSALAPVRDSRPQQQPSSNPYARPHPKGCCCPCCAPAPDDPTRPPGDHGNGEPSGGPDGAFSWKGKAPANTGHLRAEAWFEGNRKFGPSRSPVTDLKSPPPIR